MCIDGWIILFYLFCYEVSSNISMVQKRKLLQQKILFLKYFTNNNSKRNCSIQESSIVRQILFKKFYPVYEKYSVAVPSSCPLQKERDIFSNVEGSKNYLLETYWQCLRCGKQFYDENFINNHMKRKHNELFEVSNDRICLAEYCSIFRCTLHKEYPATTNRKCNKREVQGLQRKCEKLMRSCLPNAKHHYVYDEVTKSICSPLTCNSLYTPVTEISVLSIMQWMFVVMGILISGIYFLIGCCGNWEEEKVRKIQTEDDINRLYARVVRGNRRASSLHNKRR